MKHFLSAAIATSLLFAANVRAADEADTDKATAVAQAWLELIDDGHYSDSWKQAASPFQQQISQEGWSDILRINRRPLGAVKARHLANAQYTTTLPGAPDGQYVIIEFATEFEHKESALESVTPMMENGQWKISGYYVK
jgi:hypothetical protein